MQQEPPRWSLRLRASPESDKPESGFLSGKVCPSSRQLGPRRIRETASPQLYQRIRRQHWLLNHRCGGKPRGERRAKKRETGLARFLCPERAFVPIIL